MRHLALFELQASCKKDKNKAETVRPCEQHGWTSKGNNFSIKARKKVLNKELNPQVPFFFQKKNKIKF
jgi:hypothetical protein